MKKRKATDGYYGPADEAIEDMDRDNLRAFGKLKTAKFDRLNVVQAVLRLYREQAKKARKKYREIGLEAFLLALEMIEKEGFGQGRKGLTEREAGALARKTVTEEWVDELLKQTDFVTMYRFDTETERKAQRLIEALATLTGGAGGMSVWGSPVKTKDGLIDQALKQWTKQLGQYALNVTDAAVTEALDEMGVPGVFWETEHDQRVCADCHMLDGRWFRLDEVPRKPHWGCRCSLKPGENPDK